LKESFALDEKIALMFQNEIVLGDYDVTWHAKNGLYELPIDLPYSNILQLAQGSLSRNSILGIIFKQT
jgi:hypothetical protein